MAIYVLKTEKLNSNSMRIDSVKTVATQKL